MKTRKIAAFLLAAGMLNSAFRDLPLNTAAAGSVLSFAEFTAAVREMTAQDAGKPLFQEIIYDKAAGTLSADGSEAVQSCGNLRLRNGRLMIQTGSVSGGVSVQENIAYTPFEQAAAQYGYTAEDLGDTLRITNEFQTARLIVKAAGRIDLRGAESAAEGYNDLHILQYSDTAEAYAAYCAYQNDPAVEYVQPSHRITLDADASEESPYMTWGGDLIGTAEFTAEYLTAETLPEVIVAVLDSGLNPNLPRFSERIMDNGINISDSGNDTPDDDLYHGTHVTGTICELTPDSVKILPVKAFDLEGSASDEQIYLGIMYAIEQNADVLNMSFGGLGISPLEIEALTLADEAGLICCAAAGNNGDDAKYYYPGSIESCITVGALEDDMTRAKFSNYGSLVDVTAPGVGIVSYVLGKEGRTEAKNGTSMATPHAAACCALLRSYDKTITPQRTEALLRLNAKDLGETGFDEDTGWGMVCMKDFQWDDGICPAPEYSLKSGNFGQPQTVIISTPLNSAQIYYTTDGTAPSAENGILYTEPLEISETTVILAVTVREGWIQSAPAEGAFSIGGKDVADAYKIKDGVLLSYRGIRKDLTVPENIMGETVTAVGDGAFAGNHFAESITLPPTVTAIGNSAFKDCALLETLDAPNVSSIGESAFAGSELLRKVTISDAVTSVGAAAFDGCLALESFAAAGADCVPDDAFRRCEALETVSVPNAVRVGNHAFEGCKSLREVQIRWENVTAVGDRAMADCKLWAGNVCLPKLETLGEAAFSGDKKLLRVSLPSGINALPDDTFYSCSSLRLLQLPGITEIGDSAVALGGAGNLKTELDFTKITKIGENAFYGCPIGDGYETVTFSALEAIEPRMFAGVSSGCLAFPKVTAVPENAFQDANILCVYLEQAETLEAYSLCGCQSAVLTKAAGKIASNAFSEKVWIVSLDEIPALANVSDYQLCAEPLVMRVNAVNVQAAQHTASPLRVLACGIDLQYQWYHIEDGTEAAIEGAVSNTYYPDTSACGTEEYICIMTDAGGKQERVSYSVTVADTAEFTVITADALLESDGAGTRYDSFKPSASGKYRLRAEGTAAATGILTDAAGQPVAELQQDIGGGSGFTVSLKKGKTYYLETSALWRGGYAMRLTGTELPAVDIADCRIEAAAPANIAYGAEDSVAVKVTAPDGTVLTENDDYDLRTERHNQYIRIYVYGKGSCGGYQETAVPVYEKIPVNTPVPVTLDDEYDQACFIFVPRKTGEYYYYATYAPGYGAELESYQRTGLYPSGKCYVPVQTKAVISGRPNGEGTVYDQNSYSIITGSYFNARVTLNAGQMYYFTCTADCETEYRLVISETQNDIRSADIEGNLFAFYDGSAYEPEVTVSLDGTALTEGVDYQIVQTANDVPGKAKLTVCGMGLYCGKTDRQYEIMFRPEIPSDDGFTALDQPVRVTCAEERCTLIWFRAETGETAAKKVRYRILNERMTGGSMKYRLYRIDAATGFGSLVSPMSGEANDYLLANGIYCIAVYRQNAALASSADFTVLIPYSLTDAALTVENAPYTGDYVPAPLTVTAPDGTVLQELRDYKITYPDDNILFGTVNFTLHPTNRTYGLQDGSFEIYVDLPEDAPLLAVGEHEAQVTLDDRLAVYRVCPKEETTYTLCSTDVENMVLRVFSPDGEMLAQDHGNAVKSVKFTVPAGETRYLMIKFNGLNRQGTIHFRLETELRLLSECEIEQKPVCWNGARQLPEFQIRDGEEILTEGKDYSLRYTTDDVNIGTATANITGLGKYFGSVDISYQIIAPNLFLLDDLSVTPVLLNKFYAAQTTDDEYLVYSYTAGTAAELNLIVSEAQSKLTLQCYNAGGEWTDSVSIKHTGEMTVPLAAGETCYFLFSATDISSWNQNFKMILHDRSESDIETVRDTEGGISYRVSKSLGYAEANGILTDSARTQYILKPEINGVPVSYVPEALFTELPADAVFIGFAGCGASDYADTYHFIYQQATEIAGPPGDFNGDGRCSPADAVLLAAFLAENGSLNPELLNLACADFNGDGLTDLSDVRGILQAQTAS